MIYTWIKSPRKLVGQQLMRATHLCAAATALAAVQGCATMRANVPRRVTGSLHPDSTYVFVSQREAQIVFPVERDTIWRFPSGSQNTLVNFHWNLSVTGTPGPRFITATVQNPDTNGAVFSSLPRMLERAYLGVCYPGFLSGCDNPKMKVGVADGRVMLALSDRKAIRLLFGLRPDTVYARRSTDADRMGTSIERAATVRYVDPQVPEPDSVLIAWNAAEIERFTKYKHSASREIRTSASYGANEIWLELNEIVSAEATGRRCVFDGCGGEKLDAHWSSNNPMIVAIEPAPVNPLIPRRPNPSGAVPAAVLAARGIGTATVTASGLDSTFVPDVRAQPPRSLALTVHVIPRLASVHLRAARDTLTSGEMLRLYVEARDSAGRTVPGIPVTIRWEHGELLGNAHTTRDSTASWVEGPGRDQVIRAEFRGMRDSVIVHVRAAPALPRRVRQLADSSIDAILRMDRTSGINYDLFAAILSQQGGRARRARLDSLADSLLTRVFTVQDTIGPGREPAQRAIAALSIASRDSRHGYRLGLDVLVRIHREAKFESFRAWALTQMPLQSELARALNYLKDAAKLPLPHSPFHALWSLRYAADRKQPGAEQALRELWDSRAVTDPEGLRVLTAYAIDMDWR